MHLLRVALFVVVTFPVLTKCEIHRHVDQHLSVKAHPNSLNIPMSLRIRGINTPNGVGRAGEHTNAWIIEDRRSNVDGYYTIPKLAQSMWLKAKTNPKDVILALNLGGKTLKLDDNPRVLQWFKYAKAYGSRIDKFSDYDIYNLLSKTMDNGELVVLFYSLKRNPESENIGERMRLVVFDKWLLNEVHPNKVKPQLELIGQRASDIPDYILRIEIHDDYVIELLKYLQREAPSTN